MAQLTRASGSCPALSAVRIAPTANPTTHSASSAHNAVVPVEMSSPARASTPRSDWLLTNQRSPMRSVSDIRCSQYFADASGTTSHITAPAPKNVASVRPSDR